MASQAADEFLPGSNGQPTATIRHGTTILRPAGPWTPTVHALLRHLEQVGYPGSPRVVGDGYDDRGREVLTWIEGQIAHPDPYPDEAIFQVGQLLRALHDATASFRPPPRAVWQPWSLRSRAPDAVISHCNVGPWHVIVREGRPVGFIDWSLAGPTDRLEELAASGWWNAQLGFGDDLDRTRRTLPSVGGGSCACSWTATASPPPNGQGWSPGWSSSPSVTVPGWPRSSRSLPSPTTPPPCGSWPGRRGRQPGCCGIGRCWNAPPWNR